MEIISYEIEEVKCLDIELENGDFKYIPLVEFESWLTYNGQMGWINDSSDHNGEHVQSSGTFKDFEDWSENKEPKEVIKYLTEYIEENKS